MHAEDPPHLREVGEHAKAGGTNKRLVHFHNARELEVGLNELGHIVTTSSPEERIVLTDGVLTQPLRNVGLRTIDKELQTQVESLKIHKVERSVRGDVLLIETLRAPPYNL